MAAIYVAVSTSSCSSGFKSAVRFCRYILVSEPDHAADEERGLRVEQLRSKIESGDYAVPIVDVADAILRHSQLQAKVAHPDPLVRDRLEDGLS